MHIERADPRIFWGVRGLKIEKEGRLDPSLALHLDPPSYFTNPFRYMALSELTVLYSLLILGRCLNDYVDSYSVKGTNLDCTIISFIVVKSAAWRSGSERRFYDDHDRKVNGSTPNLVSLLRPWIRRFTMIISAWWSLASSKLKKSEENSTGKLGSIGNS